MTPFASSCQSQVRKSQSYILVCLFMNQNSLCQVMFFRFKIFHFVISILAKLCNFMGKQLSAFECSCYSWVYKPEKSVNLQYDMLVCWFAWTNESSTKRLMFQVLFFFHNFLQNSLQKLFQFFFFYRSTKIEMKSFECLKSMRNY